MHLPTLLSLGLLGTAASASVIKRQANDPDFVGTANIFVVPGKGIQDRDPENRIGCLTNTGHLVTDLKKCGVFTLEKNKPVLTRAGTCGFNDPTAEPGRPMLPQPYALKCSPTTDATIGFYTMVLNDGFYDPGPSMAWLWTGNINPWFEATRFPTKGEEVPIWYYTWGDEKNDRVYFSLLWKTL